VSSPPGAEIVAVETAVSTGTPQPGPAERLAAAFLLSHQGRTRQAYAGDLAHYAAWCAHTGIEMLTARRVHIDGYVEQLHAEGAAPSTVVRRLAALSGYYSYGIDENLVERNPVLRVRRPKVGDNVQSTGLSAREAAVLLAAAERHSLRADLIVNLLLFCGLRVSELCGATVADLAYERGHRVLTVTRKGGRGQRMVVPPRAADVLDRYLAGRASGPLVATTTARPLDRHAIWRLLRALAAEALPHLANSLHPHDLRHACATLSLDAGASLRDVQDLLGHQDSRTTRRYDRARHSLDRSPSHRLALLLSDTAPAGAD
jgi:integrase/recombinase XerD